jgi:hypothetical protein
VQLVFLSTFSIPVFRYKLNTVLPDCRSAAAVSVLLLQETTTNQSNGENRASRRAARKKSRAVELHAAAPDHRAPPVLQSENAAGVLDRNTSTDVSNTDQDRWKSQCARGPHLCAKNSTNRRLWTEKSVHQKKRRNSIKAL